MKEQRVSDSMLVSHAHAFVVVVICIVVYISHILSAGAVCVITNKTAF